MKKHVLFTLLFLICGVASSQVNYTAKDVVTPYDGLWRPGSNLGYNPPWDDEDLADIAAGNPAKNIPGIGAKSSRPAIFDALTAIYGVDFRVETMQYFYDLGLRENTMIVGFPAEWHRDQTAYCSDGSTESELFRNLYTDIWDDGANGTPINDENYYAVYLYNMVQTYGQYVRFWEIWNEPGFDYTGQTGWREPGYPGNWWENNPDPCDYKLRAPIFHYVRILRISWEIIKTYQPDSYVTVAGVGYESFLDAILRNTDNPVDGSPTAEYPHGGGAYFDVMGFHSYPHFDGSLRYYDSNIGGFVYERHSDKAAAGILRRQNNYQEVLSNYGFDGNTYPRKEWITTEINIPREQYGDQIGSQEAQTNFILKAVVTTMKNRIHTMHVYNLGDETDEEDAEGAFDILGLYKKLDGTQPGTQQINPEGIAYKTASDMMFGRRYDETRTNAMNLPNSIDGGAFVDENGEYQYVLWAKTTIDMSEAASATYSFPSSFNLGNLTKVEWDFSQTQQSSTISPNNIALNGRPIFLSTSSGVDNTPPAVTLSTATSNVSGPFTVNVSFSEPVTGVEVNDFLVTDPDDLFSTGGISNLSGSGTNYSFTVTPFSGGILKIRMLANRANDAAGNGNLVSNNLNVNYTIAPDGEVTINCPADQTYTIPIGSSSIVVNWSDPSTSTTCSQGSVITLTHNTGPFPGDLVTAGTYIVGYTATDLCGNGASCTFSITVEQETTPGDCPSSIAGFTVLGEYNDSKYYLSNNESSWSDAQATASANGGYLASINSAGENSFITSAIDDGFIFIGLNDANSEGNPTWASGESVAYENYNICSFCADNEADNDYAVIASWDGTWSWKNNFSQNNYIIEVPCDGGNQTSVSITCPSNIIVDVPNGEQGTTISYNAPTASTTCSGNATLTRVSGPSSGSFFNLGTTTISYQATDACGNLATCSFNITVEELGPLGGCPGDISGFTVLGEYGDSKYYLSNNESSWSNAQATAVANGGYLASVNSADENSFIQNTIDGGFIFIGLNDANSEGNPTWASGESVGYENYNICSFCKDNEASNDYVVMASWDGTWSWKNNFSQNQYIIEVPCDDTGGCVCTTEYDPVCGSDGVTYSNACLADCEGVSYTPGECSTGSDMDLQLSLTADNLNPDQYDYVNLTLTVSNTGGTTAEDIVIRIGGCDGNSCCVGFNGSFDLVYGGVPTPASIGDYRYLPQQWEIDALAPGQTGTVEIELFTLSSNPKTISAYIDSASPNDADSTPGFNSCQANEDDEVVIELIPALQAQARQSLGLEQHQSFVVNRIYPVPADQLVSLAIQAKEANNIPAVIYDARGTVQKTMNVQLQQGFNKIDLDIADLNSGMYYILFKTENAHKSIRFIKQRF